MSHAIAIEPRRRIATPTGITEVVEAAVHLVLIGQAGSSGGGKTGRPTKYSDEFADALHLLEKACDESGVLDRYRKVAGSLELPPLSAAKTRKDQS